MLVLKSPKHRFIVSALLQGAVVLTLMGLPGAANAHSSTELLNRALDAIGGREALLELDTFQVSTSGETFGSHMGFMPNDVKMTGRYNRHYTMELSTNSTRVEVERRFTYEPRHGFPNQRYHVVTINGIGSTSSGANPLGFLGGTLPTQAVAAMERSLLYVNPHLLLREALGGARTIAEGDQMTIDGQVHQTLIVSDDVAPIQLYVSDETGHISRLETLTNSVVLRDSVLRVSYGTWQQSQSVWFPSEVEVTIAGNLLRREMIEAVSEAPAIDEGTFSYPFPVDGVVVDPQAATFGHDTFHIHEEFFEIAGLYYAEGAAFSTTELAPGLVLIQDTALSGLAGLAVEMNGGLVLLEAHTSPRAADYFVDAAKAALPGRPITHLIQSHHHVDHSAGVRSIVAQGAIAVVGFGAGDWWRGVLSAESTIRPDSLSSSDVEIVVEQLSEGGEWTLSDEQIRITAYHVGENSHAHDMVITAVETDTEIFLYQADLYNAGFGFTMSFDGPQAFFEAMRARGLIDQSCRSEKPLTIVPSHGRPTSLGDGLAELQGLGIDVGCD